jgi:hypothetical protein
MENKILQIKSEIRGVKSQLNESVFPPESLGDLRLKARLNILELQLSILNQKESRFVYSALEKCTETLADKLSEPVSTLKNIKKALNVLKDKPPKE